MKRSRYTEKQIISMLKEQQAEVPVPPIFVGGGEVFPTGTGAG